jgi:hypothetical protein
MSCYVYSNESVGFMKGRKFGFSWVLLYVAMYVVALTYKHSAILTGNFKVAKMHS